MHVKLDDSSKSTFVMHRALFEVPWHFFLINWHVVAFFHQLLERKVHMLLSNYIQHQSKTR